MQKIRDTRCPMISRENLVLSSPRILIDGEELLTQLFFYVGLLYTSSPIDKTIELIYWANFKLYEYKKGLFQCVTRATQNSFSRSSGTSNSLRNSEYKQYRKSLIWTSSMSFYGNFQFTALSVPLYRFVSLLWKGLVNLYLYWDLVYHQ